MKMENVRFSCLDGKTTGLLVGLLGIIVNLMVFTLLAPAIIINNVTYCIAIGEFFTEFYIILY